MAFHSTKGIASPSSASHAHGSFEVFLIEHNFNIRNWTHNKNACEIFGLKEKLDK